MTDDVNKILNEQGQINGDYQHMSSTIQELKRVMHGKMGWDRLTSVQREALDMIAHKIGRILAGDPNFKDHWDDIAGYATLVANRCNPPQTAPAQRVMSQEDKKRLDELRNNINALYCAQCNNCMRVNAAGYVMCQFENCPNAGKKVI